MSGVRVGSSTHPLTYPPRPVQPVWPREGISAGTQPPHSVRIYKSGLLYNSRRSSLPPELAAAPLADIARPASVADLFRLLSTLLSPPIDMTPKHSLSEHINYLFCKTRNSGYGTKVVSQTGGNI